MFFWVSGVVLIFGLETARAETWTGERNDGIVRFRGEADGTVTVLGLVNTGYSGPIVIPDMFDGLPVTEVNHFAFRDRTGITSITIGANVTSIGYSAFADLGNVTSLTFNATNCDTTGFSMLASSHSLRNLGIDTAGVNVTFGDTVQVIPAYMFYHETAASLPKIIGNITIPNSVTSIGNNAFRNQQNITVALGTGVTTIGASAFQNCTGIASIIIPASVTRIGDGAFAGLRNVTSLVFNATNYTGSAFSFTGTFQPFTNLGIDTAGVNVTIGDAVQVIPGNMFYHQTAASLPKIIGHIDIPDSVTSISSSAFREQNNITVTIGTGVTTIGSFAFRNCTGLTSIIIPDRVATIGESAFHNCTGLTSIIIPASVTSIGASAFRGLIGLTSITIGTGVTSIGHDAFAGSRNVTSLTYNAINWNSSGISLTAHPFASLGADTEGVNVTFGDTVQVIPSYIFHTLSATVTPKIIGHIDIPDSVTTIGYSAFRELAGITSVTIGSGVTTTLNGAFRGCTGLTSITIPGGVETIGALTFADCTNLTSITLTRTNTALANTNAIPDVEGQWIYVPAGTGAAYRSAPNWSIEPIRSRIYDPAELCKVCGDHITECECPPPVLCDGCGEPEEDCICPCECGTCEVCDPPCECGTCEVCDPPCECGTCEVCDPPCECGTCEVCDPPCECGTCEVCDPPCECGTCEVCDPPVTEPPPDLSNVGMKEEDGKLILTNIDEDTIDEHKITFRWWRRVGSGEWELIDVPPNQPWLPIELHPDDDVTYKCEIMVRDEFQIVRERSFFPPVPRTNILRNPVLWAVAGIFAIWGVVFIIIAVNRREDKRKKIAGIKK